MHKCCVHNQTVLYLHSTLFLTPHKCNLLSTGQVTTSLEFRKNLMRGLLEEYGTTRSCPPKGGHPALDTPLWLTARHFPAEVPQTSAEGSRTRRHCKVCLFSSRKRVHNKQLIKHILIIYCCCQTETLYVQNHYFSGTLNIKGDQ